MDNEQENTEMQEAFAIVGEFYRPKPIRSPDADTIHKLIVASKKKKEHDRDTMLNFFKGLINSRKKNPTLEEIKNQYQNTIKNFQKYLG
jgi:hypothetical protein